MSIVQDHHIHTVYCGHADANMTIPVIVEKASKRGLRRIVILDHLPHEKDMHAFRRQQPFTACMHHMEAIRSDITRVMGQTGVQIIRGVEVEADPHQRDGRLAPVDLSGFAVVLAATHVVPQTAAYPWDLAGLDEETLARFYQEWIVWAMHIAANPAVHVLAHPGREMLTLGAIQSFAGSVREDFEKLLMICRKYNTAFELNERYLYGLSAPQLAEFEDLVAIARDLGVLLSLGSDAHKPKDVGNYKVLPKIVDRLGIDARHLFHPGVSA